MNINKASLIRLSFMIVIVASLTLTIYRILNQDWETVVATISLTIAVISAWIAYDTFYHQTLAQRPQLVIQPNFIDRSGLILITIKNHGENPAYNISVEWHNPIINSKEETFAFSKGTKKYDILVLGKNESVSTLLDGVASFYNKFKDSDLEYSGVISFTEKLKSSRKQHQYFNFSLTSFRRLVNETDVSITHNKLQSIPDHLESLQKEINHLRKELNTSKN
ncbi:hypothetical protein [Pontibacter burrus]|uniref:Uncharacterized protein n=1 Tax=Pontibacter burrus TaxID=2704466 RepID=A0A6B3LJX4_9BACT|nr:hypothetical protein [Pontibacter burrus]NEM97232.1 hypothetical protein [Pontibacter burrus]